MSKHIDIVFDGPPGPEAGRFVEVENADRRSLSFGTWVKRDDGYWVLRIPAVRADALAAARRITAFDSSFPRYDEWDDDLTQDARTVAAALLGRMEVPDEVGKAPAPEASAERDSA